MGETITGAAPHIHDLGAARGAVDHLEQRIAIAHQKRGSRITAVCFQRGTRGSLAAISDHDQCAVRRTGTHRIERQQQRLGAATQRIRDIEGARARCQRQRRRDDRRAQLLDIGAGGTGKQQQIDPAAITIDQAVARRRDRQGDCILVGPRQRALRRAWHCAPAGQQ